MVKEEIAKQFMFPELDVMHVKIGIMVIKCKLEDPSLKTIFKTSLSHNDFKEKNYHYIGSKRVNI
ncbi:CXXC-type zinc finger protein 1 [Aphis craccivora]|uniref:CXXC-type zinc finger protein 1 n=1 Tax=Aphis craccivora TaxID=307492 RepID=A0A6G0XYX2_APHCR|nr:CXXC-type zinc finger protein 1 [Aphis craccivora]